MPTRFTRIHSGHRRHNFMFRVRSKPTQPLHQWVMKIFFISIPVASGLDDTENVREKYFNNVLDRIENMLGENIRDHIVFRRSYAHNDFTADYNAFKGNAYGLANALSQTANLKPSIVSRKLK